MFDVHTHAFPESIARKAVDNLEKFFNGLKAKYIPSYRNLRRLLSRHGFEGAFVQNVATNPQQVEKLNDLAHRMNSRLAGKVKLIFSGVFHGEYEGYEREIERMKKLRIYFVKFQPEFQNFDPLSKEFLKFIDMMKDRFFFVFHCGYEYSSPNKKEFTVTPKKLVKIKDLIPRAKIVAAHMGGVLMWDEVLEHLAGRDIWIDTSGAAGLIEESKAKEIFKNHRRDRILFGTDYPFFGFRETIEFVKRNSGEDLKVFAEENPQKLLALFEG